MIDPQEVRWDEGGLVPAVVQDARDGRLLMVAYVDREALAATARTGEVHFHSRSRDRLWRKGETSGNLLRLRSAALDCDGDALLLTVDPVGPTCHRGTRSCFDSRVASPDLRTQGFAWLEELWATIVERARTRPSGSYTAQLLDGGVDGVGRKVTEEATELLIAAKNDADAEARGNDRGATRSAFTNEAADLLYHVLVLLEARDLDASEVVSVLRERHDGPAGATPD
jgi:phosphoribosyl-ATP pyrophosphohydrolase/phosphoribosyl-AMP cyclohydrolase